jgi:hypothetical protein
MTRSRGGSFLDLVLWALALQMGNAQTSLELAQTAKQLTVKRIPVTDHAFWAKVLAPSSNSNSRFLDCGLALSRVASSTRPRATSKR